MTITAFCFLPRIADVKLDDETLSGFAVIFFLLPRALPSAIISFPFGELSFNVNSAIANYLRRRRYIQKPRATPSEKTNKPNPNPERVQ
jgi:hypothetical protein